METDVVAGFGPKVKALVGALPIGFVGTNPGTDVFVWLNEKAAVVGVMFDIFEVVVTVPNGKLFAVVDKALLNGTVLVDIVEAVKG